MKLVTSNYSTDEERVDLYLYFSTYIYETVTALSTKFWHRYCVVEEDYIGDYRLVDLKLSARYENRKEEVTESSTDRLHGSYSSTCIFILSIASFAIQVTRVCVILCACGCALASKQATERVSYSPHPRISAAIIFMINGSTYLKQTKKSFLERP